MTVEELKKLAKETLSKKRYEHEKNVAKMAKKLAKQYGVNTEKAEKSAWIHDILKETDKNTLLQLFTENDIMAETIMQSPVSIWHGPAAAIYAEKNLGIKDKEILSAVACHTTGKENMSMLDKILYVADATSDERDYKGVEELRRLAITNLNGAVIAIMEQTIYRLEDVGRTVDPESIKALEQMKKQIKNNGGVVLE